MKILKRFNHNAKDKPVIYVSVSIDAVIRSDDTARFPTGIPLTIVPGQRVIITTDGVVREYWDSRLATWV